MSGRSDSTDSYSSGAHMSLAQKRMMIRLYEEKHVKDNDTILVLAEPKDDSVRVLAASIAKSAVEFLEQHLVDASSRPDSDSTLCAGIPQQDYSATETSEPACQFLDAEQQDIGGGISRSTLLDLVDEIRMWTLARSDAEYNKSQMYLSISAFIVYVAHWVSAKLSSTLANGTNQSQSRNHFRLILPTDETDYKPSDSDGGTRVDIGLCCSDIANPDATVGQAPLFQLMAAVGVECSNGDGDIQEAFVRLYEYTRQMYSAQYDLRFAWGVAICATEVRVCHFGPDLATASLPMDVATPDGRRVFITLLVNWSLCDSVQLGRDLTTSRVPGMDWWQIECPDDDPDSNSDSGSNKETDSRVGCYYFQNVVYWAERLFGRHTRCFAATDVEPTKEAEAAGELKPKFVVKDAWPVADEDIIKDSCDEVLMLKQIKKALSVSSSKDFIYSKIAVGGRVSMTVDKTIVEDNTDNLYKGVNFPPKIKVPCRVHRRIVTSPVGESIYEIDSVKELILVVGDVMRCHSAIVSECKILHRDISDNNILAVRQPDGSVRGLLVDFDCALDLSKERIPMLGEKTGTLPFMSINNLSGSYVKRTSLDDWESMLYLLCFYGTMGIDKVTRRSSKELENLPIEQWKSHCAITISHSKYRFLDNSKAFMEEIVSNFNSKDKDGDMLKKLTMNLYNTLFQNDSLDFLYHRTSKTNSRLQGRSLISDKTTGGPFFLYHSATREDEYGIRSLIDPFEMRAKKCDFISEQLLAVTDKAWQFVMEMEGCNDQQ